MIPRKLTTAEYMVSWYLASAMRAARSGNAYQAGKFFGVAFKLLDDIQPPGGLRWDAARACEAVDRALSIALGLQP